MEEPRAPEMSDSRLSSLHVPEDGLSTSGSDAQGSEDSVVLSLRLKRGKVRLVGCTSLAFPPYHEQKFLG
jgi:hypothetical protein